MGTYPAGYRTLGTRTRLCLPYYCTSAHDRSTARHPDSCSGYPMALDGSWVVLAVLLLGYPTVQDESGLVPVPLVLEKG